MKKYYITLLIFIISLFLFGCNSNSAVIDGTDDKPGMEGYVTSIEGRRILVVDPTPQDFSSTGGLKEFYNAIWFSNAPQNVEVGDKVQVWFDIVAESYPGQSEAKKVEILPSEKPKDAELTEAIAIRMALENLGSEYKGVTVIKEVSYDPASDTWEVVVKQDSNELNLKVEDR